MQVGLDLTKCRETPLRDGKIQFEQLCDFTEKRSNCSGVRLNANLSDSVNICNFEEIAAQVRKTLELLV